MGTVELQGRQSRLKLPIIIPCALIGVLAAGYVGLCAWVSSGNTISSGTFALGQDLGGMTVAQAATVLSDLPSENWGDCAGILANDALDLDSSNPMGWDYQLADLGFTLDSEATAQKAFESCHGNFFMSGLSYLRGITGGNEIDHVISGDSSVIASAAKTIAQGLNTQPVDTSYTLDEDGLLVTVSANGYSVSEDELESLLVKASETGVFTEMTCSYKTVEPAVTLTAEEIYDKVSGEMKNAGYDPNLRQITKEQLGADFDIARAQQLMDAADPGETIKIPATIQTPTVTAEQLKGVLFRDKLGSYTTHVGGSTARISNVKLSSAAINGTILNSGDIFDYNQVVGQRTLERGYQAAPAYVKGETVDEVGGGVCQPSSTLYLACLKSNLEITERYAHRYAPAYVPKGMDATVSWGGPNYRFRNDTNYPIKVEAVYKKNYLTMTLYGTKVDNTSVKMTNKVLSTTPSETIYQNDPTLAAGTTKVKTSPYTGFKVETYRNLYDADGKLISSKREAVSDYKVRNQIILKGPPLPSVPASGSTSGEIFDPTVPLPPENPDAPIFPGETEPTGPFLPEDTMLPPPMEQPPLPEHETGDPLPTADRNAVIAPLPAA